MEGMLRLISHCIIEYIIEVASGKHFEQTV